jgi:hypothetical protein
VKSEKHIKNTGISKRTKKMKLSTKKLKNTQNAQISITHYLYTYIAIHIILEVKEGILASLN